MKTWYIVIIKTTIIVLEQLHFGGWVVNDTDFFFFFVWFIPLILSFALELTRENSKISQHFFLLVKINVLFQRFSKADTININTRYFLCYIKCSL